MKLHLFPSAVKLIAPMTVRELRALGDLLSQPGAEVHGPQVLSRLAQRQKELERDAKQAAATGQKRGGL